MVEHLLNVWTSHNCNFSVQENTQFKHCFHQMLDRINKRFKFIDYFAPEKQFKKYMTETIQEVNKIKEQFVSDYGIFMTFLNKFSISSFDKTLLITIFID